MIEQFTNYILSLLAVFKHHSYSLYLFVFISALLESTPIIGTFMPGTLLLLLFGLLAAKGAGMLIFMIIFSIIGAMVGDTIGYLLGRYGSRFFKEHNKLLKLSHIETGRAFFNKHGGKSIIFGRFIGPIRPIISLVAGAVSFLFERFLYLNFLGACVWASSYVTIGFLFGHYIKLIDRIISQIASGVLISGIIVAIFYWYFKERKVILKD